MMTNEERKALLDATLYGIGATKNGKHIPHEDLYLSPAEAERKALVERLMRVGERVAMPCPDGIKGCAVLHFRVETDPACKEAADQIEADGKRIAELERDRAALAKQLDITQRKLKGVTKLWHADRAALGEKQ